MHCQYFADDLCRSCAWLAKPYADQLTAKQHHLASLIDLDGVIVEPPMASSPAGFRNKAKMGAFAVYGKPALGIVNHRGMPIDLTDCPLYPPDMQQLLHGVASWLGRTGIDIYDVERRRGELKFVLVTRSHAHADFMVRLVCRSEAPLAALRRHLPDLLAVWPSIKVVSLNIQPVHMAVLEGEREILLTDADAIADVFNGIAVQLPPGAFLQTNPAIASALYQTASEWVAPLQPDSVQDLFCGVGLFGLTCAPPGAELSGIETSACAVAAARQAASAAGIDATFVVGDAVADLGCQSPGKPSLVIVNPPRRGLGSALCAQLRDLAPPYLLYSSCNAKTLADDLALLVEYRLQRVRLFDMFPHTAHYETLALLKYQPGAA
ncbi:MAG: 23S rRNA (uracil(747)-C(5))-methyltransferase RlmC [Gammaproteobacteria bacterium]|nr:23S rRNA (uracil(747)-C(5))-methyltransferase RlmC [Gammaproteobacteria bacterium]